MKNDRSSNKSPSDEAPQKPLDVTFTGAILAKIREISRNARVPDGEVIKMGLEFYFRAWDNMQQEGWMAVSLAPNGVFIKTTIVPFSNQDIHSRS